VAELDPTSCYRKTELPMTKLFELKVLLDPDGIMHYVIQLNMYLFWKYVPDGNLSKKKRSQTLESWSNPLHTDMLLYFSQIVLLNSSIHIRKKFTWREFFDKFKQQQCHQQNRSQRQIQTRTEN
jgi:hypothetical protein